MQDPDGDGILCRWAEGYECAGVCNAFLNAILDEVKTLVSCISYMGDWSCMVRWEAYINYEHSRQIRVGYYVIVGSMSEWKMICIIIIIMSASYHYTGVMYDILQCHW